MTTRREISSAALIPSDALQIAPAVTALTDMALRRMATSGHNGWRNGVDKKRKRRDRRERPATNFTKELMGGLHLPTG